MGRAVLWDQWWDFWAPRYQTCCGTTVEVVPLGFGGENVAALRGWAGSA